MGIRKKISERSTQNSERDGHIGSKATREYSNAVVRGGAAVYVAFRGASLNEPF